MLTAQQINDIHKWYTGEKLYVTCYQLNGAYSILIHEKKNYSMADQFGIELVNGLSLQRDAFKVQQETTIQLRNEDINVSEEYVRLGL